MADTNDTRKGKSARDWAPRFLKALAATANIKAACEAAKVPRKTVYRRRNSDQVFAEAMADALDDAVDDMELEARRRAFEGTEKPVFQGGAEVGRIREYSDTLAIFLLKAHRPEKYRERHEVRHTGGTTVQIIEETVDAPDGTGEAAPSPAGIPPE